MKAPRSLILFVGHAVALCPMASKMLAARNKNDSSLYGAYASVHPSAGKRTVGFDPVAQLVSTTGEHAFIPPGPGDFRGPCPALNSLANHGYIPRNGIATIDQFVQGNQEVFGMGIDLAVFLSTYGAVVDGNILALSFSIGQGENSIIGPQNGLTGSHNHYEGDASPTRGDYYQYDGNNYDVQMSQFLDLYNLQSDVLDPSKVNFDIDIFEQFHASRLQQCVSTNPNYFNAVVPTLAVIPAAYIFPFRLMANKSEEYPEGRLNREVLKSFFAISGPEDNLTYNHGYERIPDNWYKRAVGDEYGLVELILEINTIALSNPEFLSIGGNTGQVDTFTGVDLADLTGGVYNAGTLLQGNNLGCFMLQIVMMALTSAVVGVLELLGELPGIVDPILERWDCPQFEGIDASLLDKFPGYSRYPGN
ncbi:hypothetical protein J3R30DRAFT_2950504 [Lentinula aciculospora]|uniref:Heme haloperoxidase family profile domain-containing protein n=1 Tax=Lentinula aciculospora TaxID=153920 RepID=A0A9W8ZRK8_9AGAR|nr:hypothetical protein J3R30DRAFT_2950504 [Lentinula aciculospora]